MGNMQRCIGLKASGMLSLSKVQFKRIELYSLVFLNCEIKTL